MFCHKCGNKVAEGGGFCHKCGTQVAQAPASTVQQAPVAPMPVDASIASAPAAVSNVNGMAQPNADFIQYVDNYVRANTKYQTAADLLLNGKPFSLFWKYVAGSVGVVILLAIINLGLALLALIVISGIAVIGFQIYINGGSSGKDSSLSSDKTIDPLKMMQFLNMNMQCFHPYFYAWNYHELNEDDGSGNKRLGILRSSPDGKTYIAAIHIDEGQLADDYKVYSFSIHSGIFGYGFPFWYLIPILIPFVAFGAIRKAIKKRSFEYKLQPILYSALSYYLETQQE